MEPDTPPSPPSAPQTPRPRTNRWLWCGVATLVLIGLAAAILGLRGTRGQMERRVEAILREARKNERRNPNVFERLVYSLPRPLSAWGSRLILRQVKGDSDYEEALVKLGTNAVPVLLLAVESDGSPAARRISVMALAEFRASSAVPVLTNALIRDTDSEVRRDVILALGQIGGEAAYQALAERWRAESATTVRQALCQAFGDIGDKRALPLLLDALYQDTALDASVAEALGNLGDASVVEPLLSLLNGGGPDVRRSAAAALGRMGSFQSVPSLKRLLEQDSDPTVRNSVFEALGMIGDPTAHAVILKVMPQLGDDREEAVWALGHLRSTKGIAVLAKELRDGEYRVRFAAAYALVEIGGAAAADALAANLSDPDEIARHGKACALTMLGRTNGLAVVRKGLRAERDWQRFSSALALVYCGGHVDSNDLKPMLDDRVPALRRFCSEAVAGRVVPALVEMLQDPKKDYRQYAARALLFFKDSSALPALRNACKDSDPNVRDAARLAVRFIERAAPSRN